MSSTMSSKRCTILRRLKQLFFLLLILTALPCSFGILEINFNGIENNSSNALYPVVKVNSSVTDNSIHVLPEEGEFTKPTTSYHKDRNEMTTSTNVNNDFNQFLKSSQNTSTLAIKTRLETTPVFSNHSSSNLTTIAPPQHHPKSKTHLYKILLYTLIPVSAILISAIIFFMVRHVQRIKRKRRLERELIHQYSYPNSEVGDLDDEQRILEVESVINTQFHLVSDQEEKNFVAEIPQVTVNIGEGSKLVLEEESPLMDNAETSTSFNC